MELDKKSLEVLFVLRKPAEDPPKVRRPTRQCDMMMTKIAHLGC